jgi:glycosyltransferase involved in cell wall biosynthesis
LIEELGENWSFLGLLTPGEMAAFFHESAVTVLPSINSTESYGLVQIESMVCGTPVVASNLPGIRVPVDETGMGRVVQPANSDELAQALIAILEDPDAYHGQPERLTRLSTPAAVAAEYETAFGRAREMARKARKAIQE